MTMRNQLNRRGGSRFAAIGGSSNFMLILTTMVIVVLIAAVFVGAAIGLGTHPASAAALTVPGQYATIQAAVDAAQPGDVIQVQPGTYRENLDLSKPVVLAAASFDQTNPTNNNTVIEAAGSGPAITIPAGLSEMPTIRGFVIQGGSTAVQAQSDFIAEFNFLRGSGVLMDYRLGSGGSNHDNVYFKAGRDAIHLGQLNRPVSIEDNRILYSGEDGIEINLQESSAPVAPLEVDIANNMILGSTEDGIQFVDEPGNPPDAARKFVIYRNLIANNARAGLGLMPDGKAIEDYSAAQISEPTWFYNNTLYGNDYGISGGGNLVAFNNIIAGSTARGAWRVTGPQGSNAVVADSLFYGNALDADQSTLGVGDILGRDPLFVAPPSPGPDGAWQTLDDDFTGLVLKGASPAVDKGATQLTATNGEQIPTTPISGFIGSAPDLGWREYGSPIFPTPTASSLPSSTPAVTSSPIQLTAAPTSTAAPATASPMPTGLSPTVPAATSTAVSPTAVSTATAAASSTATAQLSIQSINPVEAGAGMTVTITISGTGFSNGATVAFQGGQGPAPQVVSVQVVNSTTILAVVTAGNDGPSPQTWTLQVIDPGGTSASLPNSFTIAP